ncbi:non-homologous end-joining DNA ligase [Candidatus Babeliales bacterium]|nr:non-homologous end-joining DNA ligase [Candidatus Babeliales bacterium]MCF7899653.1 non-homologous end-joining DNA ligase [Candidatus Babeliales bacterium]
MSEIRIGRYTIEISNEDKILFPKSKITKLDLINYYKDIGKLMLPYTKNRAISMVRYPNGIDKEGFYQKEAGEYFPNWIKTKKLEKAGGYTNYVVINNTATLIYLVNQACITPHLWLSKIDKPQYPDRIIIDLDPSGKNFSMIQEGAIILKKRLEQLGLVPFAMTTGSRGIHIIVPIRRNHDFNFIRDFLNNLVRPLAEKHKNLFTLEMRKEKRKKLVFIDTLRNAYGQTGVAPYGVRSKENAPVATPISWKEVQDSSLKPDKYTIKNIFKRLSQIQDPWKEFFENAKSIKKVR